MFVSNRTVRKRLFYILLGGILLFIVISARLAYVQVIQSPWLSGKAEDLWSRDLPFEPERGEILDRNGTPLATNVSAPSLYVVPRQIENPAEASKSLAPVLGMTVEKLYGMMTKKESIVKVHPEGRKLTDDKVAAVRKLELNGVYLTEDSKRHYPFGSYLSHVLGFTGIDNQGLTGLEAIYNQELMGKRGQLSFMSDAKGQRLKGEADRYKAPVDGLDLRLTIDSNVQTIIERELDAAEEQYSPDGLVAIAMDPNTGEILGMSSRPDFDPESYKQVPSEVYNRNLPIWSSYEPGSTFKIITLSAALEENLIDLQHDSFYDPGYIKVAGATIKCWKRGGHGSQTYLEVVQNSCNPGFVTMGQKLGKERLFQYVDEFGFGKKTGIDLQGESSGILFDIDNVGPVEQATTSFGQGISVTPIQQVAAVAAAVNGGYLYKPYVAKEWVDPISGLIVDRQTPSLKRQVISEETSKEVRYALESVVAQGTGKNAFVEGYRVGGKTGTAQKAVNGQYLQNNYIVSFIGFAPADDPQIVVYVAVDNPKGTVQFGGVVAAPIVGNIIGDSLQAMEVPKRQNQIEKERTYLDPVLYEVPHLLGLTKKDIRNSLASFHLKHSGEGEVIVAQAPAPGEKVEQGAVIRVYWGEKATLNNEKQQD
ncbi:stage V sporulation protein D [Aureibacillus halotolerans]|uniref:serine-type D-Ala-D-Ala carboxypeptidase n=1 Tax=Aureibacillus halotolerans TaxID=1508390 RepID=A0A4R6U7J1_9BACI|nr:stage V sporulation protein D [Aureibacillus halotolerans]TDQ42321.1 stage V sporulation protein D (sporulation-specific penicillin-binding protein) [Aureibacillus halotolerans]